MLSFELPETDHMLVIAPHPDDEALGCAGTISLASGKGTEILNVYVTNGERLNGEPSAAIAETRTAEARLVSEILGCKDPWFLNLPDGDITSHQDELYEALGGVIGRFAPRLVLAPSPLDYHADHLAVSKVALKLLNNYHNFTLAFYEVYFTIRFTHLIDISAVVGIKKKAISLYTTSLYGKPELYVEAALAINTQRSLFLQKKGYYEAFWVVDRPLTNAEAASWLTYGLSNE